MTNGTRLLKIMRTVYAEKDVELLVYDGGATETTTFFRWCYSMCLRTVLRRAAGGVVVLSRPDFSAKLMKVSKGHKCSYPSLFQLGTQQRRRHMSSQL